MSLYYKLKSSSREARPRSERLRKLGCGVSAVVRGTYGGAMISADVGHAHSNKALLDAIGIDDDGYLLITRIADVESPDSGEVESQTFTDKIKAGYADMAWDLADKSPAALRFLSRLKDDTVKGVITFEQKIIFESGIKIGDASIVWDATNNALKIDRNIYSTGGITALGTG